MEITRETTINAPVERVWELLAHRFEDIADWFSGVSASEALPGQAGDQVAAGRVCTTARGNLTERITDLDDTARRFTFVIDGLPGFVAHAANTFQVEPGPDGTSRVSFRVVMTLKPLASVVMGWMFKRKINETGDQILADFKVYAETGNVSDTKARARSREGAAEPRRGRAA